MHFFELRNIQHFVIYFFPSIVSVFLIGVALAHSHFKTRRSEEKKRKPRHTFPGGIEERNEPFPLILIFVIAGTVIWAFFYILIIGLRGVKI